MCLPKWNGGCEGMKKFALLSSGLYFWRCNFCDILTQKSHIPRPDLLGNVRHGGLTYWEMSVQLSYKMEDTDKHNHKGRLV